MRALDDKNQVQQYLELKAQIQELTEQMEQLKGPLLYALMEEPEQKHQALGMEFTIQTRKTWGNYSESVTRLAEQLKLKKKQEQIDGVAEITKHQSILVVKPARTSG